MKHNHESGNSISMYVSLIVFLLLASCESSGEVTETPPFRESYVEVNGQTLYMKQWSFQGPPIIFLKGGREDKGSWQDIMPEFADSFSIFTVDTPGQGKSSKPARSFKWKDLAEDVAQLVIQEFREPVIIVGASLGAMLAGAVAAYHPKSVRALVLEDPPGDISAIFPWLRGQLKIRAMPYEERIKFYMEKGKTEEEAKKASETVETIDPVAMNELIEGRAAFDIKEILPLMKCPVLFMLGNPKKGSLAQEEYRVEFRKQAPHAKISVWPETGHHLHGPDPEKFVKEVKEFLKETVRR